MGYGTMFDGSFFVTLFILALVGLVSLFGGALYGIYWLFTHLAFV